ncbi:FtsK/SpoIIIE domain-containing protein [uncultured Amnibacterium sp.]|uniref:FtsK/SpoIIIE domain-containing protein n=1 Tax=uncultured Amnibacterium sp. TaxID=1631851 RepID=UPI0035CB6A9D
MTDRLTLPARTPPPEPPPFPLIGVIAPLILAVGLYAVLGTPTVLLIAVFSPVLAVAAVLDARRQLRRRIRRDGARVDAELAALERELVLRRSAAVAQAHRDAPSPASLAADPDRWAGRPPSGALVLGTADVPCAPLVTGAATTERERSVLASGAVLPAAPLLVPAATTVAAAGPRVLVEAFGRAVAVARLRGSGGTEGATALERTDGSGADLVVELAADATARVVHASGPAAGCAVGVFVPALLTADAHRGAVERGGPLPITALLEDPASGGLAARFLLGPDGPFDVDLVADGPHAVVGGTTGSGKSALLTAWMLALAAAHPPERVTMLLVDCKGGAAFDPLAALPHVVGVVTDLDQEEAERAVVSLGAELRRRERALRTAATADLAAAGLPRLVVVVDEYRALVDRAPALAVLFADLAARGRSLGVHLVLCTQRPAGSVREEVLANCALRISLRVHDAADSRAIVGTDAAAHLARDTVGAAVVVTDRLLRTRVASVSAPTTLEAVRAVAARHLGSAVRAPWLPPLPALLLPSALPPAPAPLVALGLADLPEEQRQPVFAWDPVRQPRLLVAGDPRTGRTTALAAAAAGVGAAPIAADPVALWEHLRDDAAPLVVDDLDHLLDRLPEPHRSAAVERLTERLRNPAAAPTVLATRGPSAWSGLPLRGLPGLVDETVLLGLPLDDHLALGGDRRHRSDRPVAGRAWCAGHRVQLVRADARAPLDRPPAAPMPAGPVLLISSVPLERGARLASAGWTVLPAGPLPEDAGPRTALVGSPATWQGEWRTLQAAAAHAAVLVDRCGAADVRTLLGVAALLPPTGQDEVVLVPREGRPERVALP